MKRIIYTIFGLLIIGFFIKNSNFLYANTDIADSDIADSDIANSDIADSDIANSDIADSNIADSDIADSDIADSDIADSDIADSDIANTDIADSDIADSDIVNSDIADSDICCVGELNITLSENNLQPEYDNVLLKIEDAQHIFEINQTSQIIDTSDYGIIRIRDPNPNNKGKGITIFDRNLGAKTTGAGECSPESYGFYYQWGNNFGFSTTGNIDNIAYSDSDIDASFYGYDNPYSSSIFIKSSGDWSRKSNDNLWGGENDISNSGIKNTISDMYWDDGGNRDMRKGPCPSGYHVPSIGEWNKLLDLWKHEYTNDGNILYIHTDTTNLKRFTNNREAAENFYKRFFIPFAGSRNMETSDIQGGNTVFFRSSSIGDGGRSYRFYGLSNDIYINAESSRANGFPVRCFYNSYRLPIIITYDTNGGHWSGTNNGNSISVTYTKMDDESNFLPNKEVGIPKKLNDCGLYKNKKCSFGGWYTSISNELRTGNITEDTTLYAQRLPFDDKDISLSGTNFTIMDRNLGSSNTGFEENAYGYYLSGGEKDISCPEGYHIPSTGEWKGILNLFESDFDGVLIRNILDLPFAGKTTYEGISGNSDAGYYLAKNGNEMMYAKINNFTIDIENMNEGDKVSVRCFKDYKIGTIKFESNGGNKISDVTAKNWREDGNNLEEPIREHSIFSGWYTTYDFQENSKLERNINYKNEEEIDLYARWDCEEGYQKNGNSCVPVYFDIQRIDGNGNILKTDSVKRGDIPEYNGPIPSKKSNSDYNYTFNGMRLPKIVEAFENTEYIAQFNDDYIKNSGGNSSGGGGRKSSTFNKHPSARNTLSGEKEMRNTSYVDSENDIDGGKNNIQLTSLSSKDDELFKSIHPLYGNSGGKNLYPQEFIDAYKFAYKYGIIDAYSIYEAKLFSPITRIEMAKMLSNYAINVLGKDPDLSKGMIQFNDITNKLNSEYDNAITKVYQLGIMGQYIRNNNFRPNNPVTRAEFSTALSRMIYGMRDGTGEMKYYEPHISKLYKEGIINNTKPDIREKRGYVMIMLMRTLQN